MLYYIDGGARKAAFAHGAVEEMHNLGAQKPDIIVANSAGIVSALAVALDKEQSSASVYEDFVTEKTFRPDRWVTNILANIRLRITGIVSHERNFVADLDDIVELVRGRHGLDVAQLTGDTEIYARVLNRLSDKIELLEINERSDGQTMLLQTAGCTPIWQSSCRLSSEEMPYRDSMISGDRGYGEVLDQWPDHNMLLIRNENSLHVNNPSPGRNFENFLKGLLSFDRDAARRYYSLSQDLAASETELQQAVQEGRAMVIEPDPEMRISAVADDVRCIRKFQSHGREVVRRNWSELVRKGFVKTTV